LVFKHWCARFGQQDFVVPYAIHTRLNPITASNW